MANEKLYNELLERGFDQTEINQFLKAHEHGVYFPRSLKNIEIMRTMREICAKHDYKFSVKQQEIILNGLLKGVDASKYANPDYNYAVMREVFCGLVNGVDITEHKNFAMSATVAKEVRIAMQNKLNKEQIEFLISTWRNYHCDLCEVRYCLEAGVPISAFKTLSSFYKSDIVSLRKKYKEN